MSIVKKFSMFVVIISFVFFIVGCSSNEESNSESILPDLPTNLPTDKPLDDLKPEVDIYYSNLLLSYIYLNVTDLNKLTLPKSINDTNISWYLNGQAISFVSGINETFKLTANIFGETKEFYVTFENGKIVSTVQHNINFYYSFVTKSYKLGPKMTPSEIVIHNTANSASASNEIKYLNSVSNTSSTSYHFAVDDTGVYQAIPLDTSAYHAGNSLVNSRSIGIEVAKSTISNTVEKDKCIAIAQKLTRLLQMQYTIESVITHKDVTGKHCPHDIIDRYGLNRFYTELKNSYEIIL